MVLMYLPRKLFISCKEMKGNYTAENSDNSLTSSSKVTRPVRGLAALGEEAGRRHVICVSSQLRTYAVRLTVRKHQKTPNKHHFIKKSTAFFKYVGDIKDKKTMGMLQMNGSQTPGK